MKSPSRVLVLAVLLFTASAVAMLWGLSVRWQGELRTEVMARAEQRALQLSDALAGQKAAEFALMDHALRDLRKEWALDPTDVEKWSAAAIDSLPPGMVSHLSVVNAEGRVVYNSLGKDGDAFANDRLHFQAARSEPDHLVIGAPVISRLSGEWLIPVARPLYREGRFAGEMVLAVSTEFLAKSLARLALSEQDVVVLIHPTAKVMAHSVNNSGTLGKMLPLDRPFFQSALGTSGTYRENGAEDDRPRLFGWQRLPGSGLVLVVGLAESSVFAPLASTVERSRWLTGALSLLLLVGGSAVAWLLWRVERSAQAVGESARLLEDAQKLAKVGHWSLDLRTRSFIWSDEVYRIMGMRRSAGGVTYDDIAQRVYPEDRAAFTDQFDRAIQGGVKMDVAHRVVLPDGSIKHVHALGIFELENGEPVRCQGTLQDVTEVRSAQLALQDLNDALEERVDERTRELGALNNELEAFTYSVSHDLRTPLRSIHGFASLLEEEAETLSPEGRSHLRRIQDGARRMGLLITDLLTMAHQSRAEVHSQVLNLSELAHAVVVDVEREDPQRKVDWNIEAGLQAMADPVLLRVVLQNLLGNAWKYTSQTAHPVISFQRTGRSGGMVEFCVRDNGAGFDMAYVDQLFKPFKRLHAHHEFEGSGIGLASVQRLIQRHGGTVRAEGAVEQGAAIRFTLPEVPGRPA